MALVVDGSLSVVLVAGHVEVVARRVEGDGLAGVRGRGRASEK